jgi:hypothetical protein
MDMHVNEAGQYSFARHVDMCDIAAPFDRACIGNAGYTAIRANENSRKIDRFTSQNIDHLIRGYNRRLRLCRRGQNGGT